MGGGGTAPAAGLGTAEAVERGQLSDLLERIRKPGGGFTYNAMHGSEPTEGFAVSPFKDPELSIPADKLDLDALYDYTVKNHDLLSQEGNHFGAWHDPD